MLCFQISPWGDSIPHVTALVEDNPESGQTLHLMTLNIRMEWLVYGPDLMHHCWMDRPHWPLGIIQHRQFTSDPGFLFQINFWKPGERRPFSGKLEGYNAFRVCQIFEDTHRGLIGELWQVHPKGEIKSKNFAITVSPSKGLTITPLLGGQSA